MRLTPRMIRRAVAPVLVLLLLVGGLVLAAEGDPEVGEEVSAEAPADTLAEAMLDADVAEPEGYTPAKASFAVQVRDDVIPYEVMGVYVMPGETLRLEAVFTQGRGSVEIEAEAGPIAANGPERWTWTAPTEPGPYAIRITDAPTGETITLNAFVKVPFDHRQEALNGFRIGNYQARPLRGNPVYDRPEGFVEITPETRDMKVSPHFTLGQFRCKQELDDYPQYLVLRERLLLKLEMILEEVNHLGIPSQTLHVMSGFRTPYYNASIGNRTKYSRHLYGGAADIYVDTNEDNHMDDLDGDGRVTRSDAQVLAAIVEDQTDETWYQPFVGGLGIYGPAAHRGPFIHVDVRGRQARW